MRPLPAGSIKFIRAQVRLCLHLSASFTQEAFLSMRREATLALLPTFKEACVSLLLIRSRTTLKSTYSVIQCVGSIKYIRLRTARLSVYEMHFKQRFVITRRQIDLLPKSRGGVSLAQASLCRTGVLPLSSKAEVHGSRTHHRPGS